MSQITCSICYSKQERRSTFSRDDKDFCSLPCVRSYVAAWLEQQKNKETEKFQHFARPDAGGSSVH